MRVLGVACSGNEAFLTLAEDQAVVGSDYEKLTFSSGTEDATQLRRALGEMRRVLDDVEPDLVRLLLPEQTYKDSYLRIAPRVTLETLVRVACDSSDTALELLKRSSARARLGLPRGGRFEERTTDVVGPPVGRYWSAGRNLAAAAALADEKP